MAGLILITELSPLAVQAQKHELGCMKLSAMLCQSLSNITVKYKQNDCSD